MSSLPGRRHRTMAPSSVLREADIAAMEATNAALVSGSWALREESIDTLSGVNSWGYLSTMDHVLEAVGVGLVKRFPVPLYDRSILASFDVWVWQAVADAPIVLEVVLCHPSRGDIDVLASSSVDVRIREYIKRSIGLVNPTRGRPLGYKFGTDRDTFVELRATSGAVGDRISGVSMYSQRPPQ